VKTLFFLGITLVSVLVSETLLVQTAAAQSNSARELAGLWQSKRRFGPDVRGSLLVKQSNGEWRAEVTGHSTVVKIAGDAISFELPGGNGAFQGKFDARRTKIVGHWIQPATVENGTPYASPVTLTKNKQNIWRGFAS
jgi:hypothetical protein